MVDENLVTVTNNENPVIELQITSYTNQVSVDFVESIESALSVHNSDEDAHAVIVDSILDDIDDLNNSVTSLTTVCNNLSSSKADASTTYTKTQTDSLLTAKVDTSDATVTKQGNTFNGASQLVQMTSASKLPAVDGSLLTNLVTRIGSCSTASATTEKAVTLSGFVLYTGATIQVSFNNANTATAPTLNVNSTGAKAIYFADGIAVDSTHPFIVQAGEKQIFIYDGTNWVIPQRAKYDSGWFSVSINTSYAKSHCLGTSNLSYRVFIADDSCGTNKRPLAYIFNTGSGLLGWYAGAVSSTSITIVTAANYVGISTSGTNLTSAYYKIVAEVQ